MAIAMMHEWFGLLTGVFGIVLPFFFASVWGYDPYRNLRELDYSRGGSERYRKPSSQLRERLFVLWLLLLVLIVIGVARYLWN